ncbi:MAG: replication initiation and membrane attachment family protein, partial [Vagococcus fluvialis]
MSEAWEKLKPKDKFSVIKTQHVSEVDYVVLNMLYQPIVGTGAIGLFNLLLMEEKINNLNKIEQHSILLNQLDMGIPDFFAAREKLEAVGLLKTFVKALDNENHVIYEVQPIMSPSKFLHDDILSLLLVEKLGFEKVEEISHFFSYNRENMEDYVEVTKSFVDVFRFDSNRLISKTSELSQIKEIVTKKEEIAIKEVTNSFDWLFFMSLVESLHIDEKQIKVELKRTIELFHQLYGINELEMFDYVKQSVDYVTNRVMEKEFKQLIYKGYHSRKKQEVTQNDDTNKAQKKLTNSEKNQLRENTLKLTGFLDEEISVILACDSVAPLLFLKAIKTQKGGFVSSNERWAVENLNTQSSLPDSVINMLIHYLLVVQGNSSLNQNIMMSIANDWAQKKIFSPEEALNQVKKLQETKKQPARSKSNYNQPKRK